MYIQHFLVRHLLPSICDEKIKGGWKLSLLCKCDFHAPRVCVNNQNISKFSKYICNYKHVCRNICVTKVISDSIIKISTSISLRCLNTQMHYLMDWWKITFEKLLYKNYTYIDFQLIYMIFFVFIKKPKHRFSCEHDILELKIWY